MDNIKTYFETAQNLREGLRETWAEYQKGYDRLQGYNGTRRYNDDLKQLQEKRDERIKLMQDTARGKFDRCISNMRENVANTPTVAAPTAKQLGIIQLLRMRENVTLKELQDAGKQLKGVDAAVKVLDEIATKSGHRGAVNEYMGSIAKAEQAIDELARSANMLIDLTRPDGIQARHAAHHFAKWGGDFDERHEGMGVHSPNSRLSLSAVDVDVKDEREAMRLFGSVKDYGEFRSIVNRDRTISEEAQRRAGEI